MDRAAIQQKIIQGLVTGLNKALQAGLLGKSGGSLAVCKDLKVNEYDRSEDESAESEMFSAGKLAKKSAEKKLVGKTVKRLDDDYKKPATTCSTQLDYIQSKTAAKPLVSAKVPVLPKTTFHNRQVDDGFNELSKVPAQHVKASSSVPALQTPSVLYNNATHPSSSSLMVSLGRMHAATQHHLTSLVDRKNLSDYLGDVVVCSDSLPSCSLLLVLLRGGAAVTVDYLHAIKKEPNIGYANFELAAFKRVTDRPNLLIGCLQAEKVAIDTFPGSTSHPIIADRFLPALIECLGGVLVTHNTQSDMILSDRSVLAAKSSVFKKVDYRWLVDSILQNSIQDKQTYQF